MPIAARSRFDFNITIHPALTGEPQLFLIAESPEKQQRTSENSEAFPQARTADIFLALGDQHFTTATVAKAHTVENLVRPPIQRHSVFKCDFSQVATGLDVDAFLFVDERDLGHSVLRLSSLIVWNSGG